MSILLDRQCERNKVFFEYAFMLLNAHNIKRKIERYIRYAL